MPLIDTMKLRREQQKLKDEMRKLCDAGLARESKRMTDEEGAQYEKFLVDVRAFDGQIELAERSNSLETGNSGNHDNGENSGSEDRSSEGKFSSFGEFLTSVRSACTPGGSMDQRLEFRSPSGANTLSNVDGGFLVGKDMLGALSTKTYSAKLASKCDRSPIGPNSNGAAWNRVAGDAGADASRHGGVIAYWASEAGTATAKTPQFRKVKLDLEKLMAFFYATDEQLQDSTNLEAEYSKLVGAELGWQLDKGIFQGTGAGVPLGIMNSPAMISVAKEAGQKAGTIVFENISKMVSRLDAEYIAGAEWYINQDCLPQLSTMALVVGVGGVPVYLPATGISGSPYSTLYGRPVVPIEHCKTCGTTGDIVLANLSQYKIIEKGGVKQDMSIHVRYLYGENCYRTTLRVNGMPMPEKPYTPANSAITISPFVKLDTRA